MIKTAPCVSTLYPQKKRDDLVLDKHVMTKNIIKYHWVKFFPDSDKGLWDRFREFFIIEASAFRTWLDSPLFGKVIERFAKSSMMFVDFLHGF